MKEASQKSPPATSTDLSNVTFSQALEDGLTHSGWLVGPTTDPSGQDRALASHSVAPEKAKELTMNVTFGPLFGGSSPSETLQNSLESRLRVSLEGCGCLEYELTWKRWDMQSGPPICALRASARRTSAKEGFGEDGWPKTPLASDAEGGVMEIRPGADGKYKLRDWAQMASGWPPSASRDHKDTPGMSIMGKNPDGSERARLDQLPRVAGLTGPDQSSGPAEMESSEGCLPGGWMSPKASDCKSPGISRDVHLKPQAEFAGNPTPRTPTGGAESADRKQELGRTDSGGSDLQAMAMEYALPNMEGWKLNPFFSLWLMGYPPVWAFCGGRGTPSFQSWLQSLSEHTNEQGKSHED